MNRAAVMLVLVAGGCTDAGGTSSTSGSTSGGAGSSSASSSSASSGSSAFSSGEPDAGPASTSITVTVGGVVRTLPRAQLGLDRTDGGGDLLLYVEAHEGGDPACPGPASPTPLRTLILANIRPVLGVPQTSADGIRATLLDFVGDQVSGPAPLRASNVTVTVHAVTTEPAADARVSLTLSATFEDGSAVGEVAATHCDSLDG